MFHIRKLAMTPHQFTICCAHLFIIL